MASITLYLDKRRACKNDTYPLRICISHLGSKAYVNTGIRLTAEQYQNGKITNHPHKNQLNQLIMARVSEYQLKLVETMANTRIKSLTATQLRDIIVDGSIKPKLATFKACLDRFIETKETERTRDIYRATWILIKKFCNYNGTIATNITFNHITALWLSDLDRFLVTELKSKSANGRAIHMRNIRAVFNFAIANKAVSKDIYPFDSFKIKTEETARRSISYTLFHNLMLNEVRSKDYFALETFRLIVFLIGINAHDLFNLKKADVYDGRLHYKRAKTGRLYDIKIEPEAMNLIDKYKAPDDDPYLLDFHNRYTTMSIWLRETNKRLKRLAAGLIGQKDITTYYARHTWATLANDIDIPKDTIAACLGHGSKTVTDVYINYNSKKIDDANRKVINYALNKDE